VSRGLSTGQAALSTGIHRVTIPLVEMLFDSGTLRLALNQWDVNSGGTIYIGTGPLLKVEKIPENATSIEGIQFTMSGLDPAIFALATQEPYQGRIARVLKGYADPNTYQLIGAPVVRFPGRMRSFSIIETNNQATVTLAIEHFDAEFARPWPFRYSNSDQQRAFPGDKGCEYVEQMTERTIVWPSKEALRK
jgi:hypothetical protein